MTGITGRTKIIGVWGHPVSHSRSPAMHNAALRELGLDWAYVPFDVDPVHIAEALAGIKALGMVGVNVTVPLKELVWPYAILSPESLQTSTVNTIHHRDGALYGYSTDGSGFLRSLADVGQAVEGRRALILGAGGSARAIAFALASQGSHCQIANRTPARADMLAADVNLAYPGSAAAVGWGRETDAFDLLVNTTSLGMSPNEDALPALPPEAFAGQPLVYDLIYAPARTKLLALADQAGCATMNGVKMLAQQGALSLAIWTGLPVEEIPVGVMEQAVRSSLQESH